MQRRGFLSGMASAASLAAGSQLELLGGTATAAEPGKLAWGVCSSALQTEGGLLEDGRGESIWDQVKGGKPPRGPEPAADSYHRWREDVELLRGLGVSDYRFSVSWPRVLPAGTGATNAKGLDYYSRLVDALLEAGITPWVCLHHWDLPSAVQEDGGWIVRETVPKFVDYAGVVFRRLGDRVRNWAPLNEPNIVAYAGYATGVFAPGIATEQAYYAATHHQNLAQGLALKFLLAADHNAGPILSLQPARPATSNAEDITAAGLQDLVLNRAFLDPLLNAKYPSWLAERIAPLVKTDDLAVIAVRPSFIGVNYYGPQYRRFQVAAPFANEGIESPPTVPHTGFDEIIDPHGLTEVLLHLHRAYDAPALVVTENGASFPDAIDASGSVVDMQRTDYLIKHVNAVRDAIKSGAPVTGYFIWSLLDNWEWTAGYDQRFGLVYVDFETGRRTPKASYDWYRKLVRGEN